MNRKPLFRHLLFMTLLLALSLLFSNRAMAQTPSTSDSVELRVNLPPLCRFGVNVNTDNGPTIENFDTRPLRLGWYVDYGASANPANPNGAIHAPMIRLNQPDGTKNYTYSPSGATLSAAIAANPGAIWLISNEPDRIEFQDGIDPDVYATAYHDLYHLIKAADPSARIYAGNIVQATAIRLQYLDLILASYRSQYGKLMPVDGWSIHGFILNEERGGWGAEIPPGVNVDSGLVIDVQQTTDVDLFKLHVVNFRDWMKRNGYRNTPLAMSEFGVLMPKGIFNPDFDEGRVNAFMDATFDFLLTKADPSIGYPKDNNRLVQQLSWYSTSDNVRHNGHLYSQSAGNTLTLMGENYARYAENLPEQTDFFPVSLVTNPSILAPNPSNNQISLVAEIANAGNNQNVKTVNVDFYLGDPEAGGQLLGTKTASLRGCGQTTRVSLTWPNPPSSGATPDYYVLYAKVTAADATIDVGSNNTTVSVKVYNDPELLFMPSLSR